MAHYYTGSEGALWVQPDGPGTKLQFLGCHQVEQIDELLGDLSPLLCADVKQIKEFVATGHMPQPGGMITFTVLERLRNALGGLEELRCPFVLYVTLTSCGRKDVFENADLVYIYDVRKVTQVSLSNVALMDSDEPATVAYDVSVLPPSTLVRGSKGADIQGDTSVDLNHVTFCSDFQCADCGSIALGQNGIVASNDSAPTDVIYGYVGTDGGVYVTTNFTVSGDQPVWSTVNTGLPSTDVQQLGRYDSSYVYARTSAALLRLAVGGGSWTTLLTPAIISSQFGHTVTSAYPFAVSDGGILYSVWRTNDALPTYNLYVSTNNGDTWTVAGAPWTSGQRGDVYQLEALGSDLWAYLFAGSGLGNGNYIFYSPDQATTKNYQKIARRPIAPITIGECLAHDGSALYSVIYSGGFFFTQLASGDALAPTRPFQGVWVDPDDTNHHRILRSGNLYTTDDFWTTYTNQGAMTPAVDMLTEIESILVYGKSAGKTVGSPHSVFVTSVETDTTPSGRSGDDPVGGVDSIPYTVTLSLDGLQFIKVSA